MLEMWNFILVNSGGIIATSAVVVSVGALIQNRKHNRLSIKPQLTFGTSQLGKKFILSVTNAGLGPAKIKSFEIYYNNSIIDEGHNSYFAALKNIFSVERLSKIGEKWLYLDSASILHHNKPYTLLILNMSEFEEQQRRDYGLNIQEKLNIKITYLSIYEEEFTVNSNISIFI